MKTLRNKAITLVAISLTVLLAGCTIVQTRETHHDHHDHHSPPPRRHNGPHHTSNPTSPDTGTVAGVPTGDIGASTEFVSVGASVEVDFGFFYERLSPSGYWVELDTYGWVWYPADVDDDWRPYTRGHWVYCDDYGWTWNSEEDSGWATCHYGRWTHDRDYGWVWCPGYEWSGAWVVWRHGGGHYGWAALPPAVTFDVSVGLRLGDFRYETDIYEPSWVFVAEADICAPRVSTVVIRTTTIRTVIVNTSVVGSVSVHNNIVVNNVVQVNEVERVTRKKVVHVQVTETQTLGEAGIRSSGESNIRVFKPRVKGGGAAPTPDNDDRREKAARKTLVEKQEAETRAVVNRQSNDRRKDETEDSANRRHQNEKRDIDKRHQDEDKVVKTKPVKPPRKVAERKQPERKEPERKQPERNEPERKQPERKEPERKQPERKEPERKQPERKEPERKDPEKERGRK